MKHTVALKQNHEFRRLYSKGRNAASPYFAVYCRRTGRPYSRLGLTTGVKLGNAVKRNRVRRRLREIYRLNSHQLKTGWDIVIVARSRCVGAEYSRMDAAFMAACEKLSLRREAKP